MNVKRTERLGEGAYGVVYKGYNGNAGANQLPNVLAIKVVELSSLNLAEQEQKKIKRNIMIKLAKECDLLRKLKHHPNIVKYYGFL
jgi:serine/threonine protein kinase